MTDQLLRHTFSQSHRRTIDVNHLAKRQTAFVIERATLPPAPSASTPFGPSVRADAHKGRDFKS